MKCLLVAVNAKYIHSNPAIYSLRACAGEELRQYLELGEYTINQPMAEILADIYDRNPDIIAFSCYIWNWRLVRELLGELPKLLPKAELWLGGPEVSYDADVILGRYPQLSGIMIGEGEATFRELLMYYAGDMAALEDGEARAMGARACTGMAAEDSAGRKEAVPAEDFAGRKEPVSAEDSVGTKEPVPAEDSVRTKELIAMGKAKSGRQREACAGRLQDIPGLCLPGTGYTPCRPLTDLSAIPFLYDDLKPFENRILYYETSRGCPFRCSYCLSSIEKKVRLRDRSMVERELQFFLDNGVKQVKFIDRTFNCSHEHAMAVWTYLQEHDNGVTNFHFEISADILREDEIELLNRLRPGLAQLEIGVQSTNPKTLEAVERRTDLERLEKAVAAIRRGRNIHLHLDLIAGLPFEGYESFARSFDRVYRMGPDQLQLGFLKVLKGSRMWELAEEYGIRYLEQPPYEVLYTKWLSYEEVLRLKRVEEMVELYYNSGQFTHTIPFLEKAFPGPFALYEALADFYGKRGYFTASPARAYRYHVLLEFAVERDGLREDAYRELLTYDMYLRENIKSRPDFAADLSDYRDRIRQFYQQEEKERNYLPEYGEYDWKQLGRMTHLEPFSYPVWDIPGMAEVYGSYEESQVQTGQRFFVLFDYRERNPLTWEAAVHSITALSASAASE